MSLQIILSLLHLILANYAKYTNTCIVGYWPTYIRLTEQSNGCPVGLVALTDKSVSVDGARDDAAVLGKLRSNLTRQRLGLRPGPMRLQLGSDLAVGHLFFVQLSLALQSQSNG